MAGWIDSVRNVWPLKSFLNYDNTVKQETADLPGHKFTAALEPWESYMMTTQSLLIWEKPSRSIIALIAANVIFWLVVWSEPKLYFVLGSVGLGIFLHHQWLHCIWPEIRVPPQPGERHKDYTDEWLHLNPSVLQAPEVGVLLEDWCSSMHSWLSSCLYYRRHRPALFCVSASSVFVMMLLAGQLVSGTALLYGLLMGMMLLPGVSRYALPALKVQGATLCGALADRFIGAWNALVARAGPTFCRAGGDGGDSSPDELSEFLPDSATEEAEAALTVPLLAADPPEVVAALERVQQQDPYDENIPKPPPRDLRAVTASEPSLNPSPYNSLTPHIPTHSVPSVSDSSDEEEQEFMQGLVFDSIRRDQHSSLAVRPSGYSGVGHHPDLSLSNFSQEESLGYDQIDLDGGAMSRYGAGGGGSHYGGYPAADAPISTAAMQSFASTFLQQPSGGALLSSIGQSMLSSVMANMAPASAPEPARTAPPRVRKRHEISDDDEESYGRFLERNSDRPASVSEGVDSQLAVSDKATHHRIKASGGASRGHATGASSLVRRRRQPVRRSARRAAVSVAAAARGGDIEEVSSGSALDDCNDDDFEIISDEEFSE